ncbi:MAG: DNA-directed RNA polymerase I [Oscillospiraceae bacterium]|nr:DNA-directed RNA polymerase I [Oscillospiraceae bacterium]
MKIYDGWSDALREALDTGIYVCSQCGSRMYFTDEHEDVLMCSNEKCLHNIPFERYGAESDEEYYALFPTEEEICGIDLAEEFGDEDEDEDE